MSPTAESKWGSANACESDGHKIRFLFPNIGGNELAILLEALSIKNRILQNPPSHEDLELFARDLNELKHRWDAVPPGQFSELQQEILKEKFFSL